MFLSPRYLPSASDNLAHTNSAATSPNHCRQALMLRSPGIAASRHLVQIAMLFGLGLSMNTHAADDQAQGFTQSANWHDQQAWLVVDKADLQRQEFLDLADVLRQFPAFNGGGTGPRNSSAGRESSAVNLRGLGDDETLVLVDGWREIGTADLSSIPLAMVERIEVLPPSALQGSGGRAGVVNIVTRREQQGGELSLRYGEHFDRGALGRQQSGVAPQAVSGQGGGLRAAASWGQQLALAGEQQFSTLLGFEFRNQEGITLSPAENAFDFLGLGVNLDSFRPQSALATDNLAAPANLVAQALQEEESWHGFAQASWSNGTALRARVGLRYGHSEDDADQYAPVANTGGLLLSRERDVREQDRYVVNAELGGDLDPNWSWQAGLSWGREETDRENSDHFLNRTRFTTETVEQQRQLRVQLQGQALDLGAGPWAWRLGYEQRREQFDYRFQAGPRVIFVDPPRPRARQERDQDAFFLSSEAPLWRGADGAGLVWHAGLRWDDGEGYSGQWNWDTGLNWAWNEQIRLYAEYGTNYRAPELSTLLVNELLADGQSLLFPFAIDPCAAAVDGQDSQPYQSLSPEQRLRCTQLGVPAGGVAFSDSQLRYSIDTEALRPEQSRQWRGGLNWAWNEQLSLNLEHWRLRLDDSIRLLGADEILNGCIREGIDAYCQRQQRFDNGAVESLNGGLTNIGRQRASGLDATLSYQQTSGWGSFQHQLRASHVLNHEYDDGLGWVSGEGRRYLSVAVPADGIAGEGIASSLSSGSLARWRGLWTSDWRHGPWSAGLSLEYQSGVDLIVTGQNTLGESIQRRDRDTEARWYLDLSLGYTWSSDTQLSLGLGNLFNEAPPLPSFAGLTPDSDAYPLAGRRWFASLRQAF